MKSRSLYAIAGLIVGTGVDVIANLIAAGIQQHTFADQFSNQAIWGLVGLAFIGLLIGYWLGKPLSVPSPSSAQTTSSEKLETITITRLQALWSHNKVKGKGIHLNKIFLLGSTNEVDTE
jgi:hypothetical protein